MKKVLSTLLILIFTVTIALAHGFGDETTKQLNMLKTELNLSESQYERIGHTIDNLVKEEMKIKTILKDSPDAMKARLAEVKRIKIKNLKGGLTKQQIATFDKKELEDRL